MEDLLKQLTRENVRTIHVGFFHIPTQDVVWIATIHKNIDRAKYEEVKFRATTLEELVKKISKAYGIDLHKKNKVRKLL